MIFFKNISTHLLTLLIISVIVALEQITKSTNLEMEGFYEHQQIYTEITSGSSGLGKDSLRVRQPRGRTGAFTI